MIEGVTITPLKRILDERGWVAHMLRSDDPHFKKFGEIYFSAIYPGAIKGWHLHKTMTLNYAVVCGAIKLVVYDDRPKSKSYKKLQEIFSGEIDYKLISIPPGVWNGFKAIGTDTAIVANCSTHPYDPKDMIKIDPIENNIISYNWDIVHE